MSLDVVSIQQQYIDGILDPDSGLAAKSAEYGYWFRCKLLATIIAGNVFGLDWFEKNLASERRPGYLRLDLRSENTYPRSTTRVIELGEMVWNLYAVPGFEERAKDIQTAGRDVETRIGELMGGRFFRQMNIQFAFRPPKGQKQEDFDIDYERIDGKPGRCEVKCKLQETGFSASTIRSTLKSAKSQLPKNETGIILLRTPEEWVPFENGVANLQAIIDTVKDWFTTEKTQRVSSIVTFDSRTDVVDSTVYTGCYYKEFRNPYCSDLSGLPDYFIRDEGSVVMPRNWTTIPDLVKSWEPRLTSAG
jgi:hypothetical protein